MRRRTVIFKAFVYDSHGHQAHFEGAVEVDADLAVAQRDAEAGQRLISYCVGKSTQAVLKLQPSLALRGLWRCSRERDQQLLRLSAPAPAGRPDGVRCGHAALPQRLALRGARNRTSVCNDKLLCVELQS